MPRSAFTLMEVIIALAILAVALTVLVEVSRLSLENARLGVMKTEATLVAESVLAELEAGSAELTSFQGDWAADETAQSDWSYAVTVEGAAITGLLAVTVRVTELPSTARQSSTPLSFTLMRWFQDPAYLEQITLAAESGA